MTVEQVVYVRPTGGELPTAQDTWELSKRYAVYMQLYMITPLDIRISENRVPHCTDPRDMQGLYTHHGVTPLKKSSNHLQRLLPFGSPSSPSVVGKQYPPLH